MCTVKVLSTKGCGTWSAFTDSDTVDTVGEEKTRFMNEIQV